MKTELATQTEIDTALLIGKSWAKGHPMFTSTNPSLAVSEFYLNQKGKTMYDNMVSE